jgi:hypothetical protein
LLRSVVHVGRRNAALLQRAWDGSAAQTCAGGAAGGAAAGAAVPGAVRDVRVVVVTHGAAAPAPVGVHAANAHRCRRRARNEQQMAEAEADTLRSRLQEQELPGGSGTGDSQSYMHAPPQAGGSAEAEGLDVTARTLFDPAAASTPELFDRSLWSDDAQSQSSPPQVSRPPPPPACWGHVGTRAVRIDRAHALRFRARFLRAGACGASQRRAALQLRRRRRRRRRQPGRIACAHRGSRGAPRRPLAQQPHASGGPACALPRAAPGRSRLRWRCGPCLRLTCGASICPRGGGAGTMGGARSRAASPMGCPRGARAPGAATSRAIRAPPTVCASQPASQQKRDRRQCHLP